MTSSGPDASGSAGDSETGSPSGDPDSTGTGEPPEAACDPTRATRLRPASVGVNVQTSFAYEPWSQPGRLAGAEAIAPRSVRYPGGTVANYWDFESDRLLSADVLDTSRMIQWIGDLVAAGIGDGALNSPGDFARLVDATSSEAFLVANMVTPGYDAFGEDAPPAPGTAAWNAHLQQRLARFTAFISRAEQAGLSFPYIELGNEYFFNIEQDYPYLTFPGLAESYADAANAWAAALASDGVTLGALATHAPAGSAPRRADFNTNVVTHYDRGLIDALIVHHYPLAFDPVNDGGVTDEDLDEWLVELHAEWLDDETRSDMTRLVCEDEWEVWITEFHPAFQQEVSDKWAAALALSEELAILFTRFRASVVMLHQLNDIMDPESGERSMLGEAYAQWTVAAEGATQVRVSSGPGDARGVAPDGVEIPQVRRFDFLDDAGARRATVLANYGGEAVEVAHDAAPTEPVRVLRGRPDATELESVELPAEMSTALPGHAIALVRFEP